MANEHIKKRRFNVKKIVLVVSMIISIIAYMFAIDPDTELLKNLPFGSSFIFALSAVVMSFMGIVIVETIPDMFTDELVANRETLADKARQTPTGAGMVLIALSIRILAYAIIFAAAVKITL